LEAFVLDTAVRQLRYGGALLAGRRISLRVVEGMVRKAPG
jgi:hypothetical protein